jgi:hypothetical protein
MILTSVYHILKKNVAFDQNLYQEYYHQQTRKFNNVSIPKMISFLSTQGLRVITSEGEILGLAKSG